MSHPNMRILREIVTRQAQKEFGKKFGKEQVKITEEVNEQREIC